MPADTPFQLPRPSQPVTHHALGLHNAPVFEYDLQEFGGDDGNPVVVIEPRRMDGKPQGPFRWFRARLLEAINQIFDGDATIIIHDRPLSGGEHWWVSRDVPVPVFNDQDPAVRAQLHQIQTDAEAAGVRPDMALQQAVMSGAIKPDDVRMQHALVEIDEKAVTKVLTALLAHHVEPPLGAVGSRRPAPPVGFAAQAAARQALNRGPAAPAPGLVA